MRVNVQKIVKDDDPKKENTSSHSLTESFCELSWNPHYMAGPVLRA